MVSWASFQRVCSDSCCHIYYTASLCLHKSSANETRMPSWMECHCSSYSISDVYIEQMRMYVMVAIAVTTLVEYMLETWKNRAMLQIAPGPVYCSVPQIQALICRLLCL